MQLKVVGINMKKILLKTIIEKPLSGEWGQEDEPGNGTPIIRTTNFTNVGEVNYSNIATRLIDKKVFEKKVLKPGDILIEKSGGSEKQAVGRVIYFEGENNKYLFNNFTSVLRIKNNVDINSKYLFYYLFNYYKNGGTLRFQNKTTGLHNLKLDKMINAILIPIFETKEQKKICKILDKLYNCIKLRQKQISELDILIKSRFIEMFGDPITNPMKWDKYKLNDVCNINPKKSNDNRLIDNLKVSFVSMSSVSEKGNINASFIKSYKEVKRGFTYFAENDVLFAKITPCMENGKGAIAINLKNGIGFGSTEFHVIRPIEGKTNAYWIYCLTMFDFFRNDAERKMTGSAGQRRVPASFLINYTIGVPPIDMQNQFAIFVQHINRTKLEIQKSLVQVQLLFDSLMQKYFG